MIPNQNTSHTHFITQDSISHLSLEGQWYSSGCFHLKFEITDEEMKVFSTNPNEV
ncbi:hypothetical protein [Helicobacter cinaedi]|uniref:hypothetical protein n=1 Tax=Helicobacter cinaedi TaxID=213 RepID=UPI001403DCA4|nr:hypothetical protein [Helicobacter cinaedi]